MSSEREDAKQEVRDLLDRLPDDVSLEDVLYHLYVYTVLQERIATLDTVETIPREQVVNELGKWLRRAG